MHHSSFYDTSSRIIPTRYETDLWRSSPRWEVAPFSHTPPFPTTPFPTSLPPMHPPPEFSSSMVHYPSRERQQHDFDREMRRMNDEMTRMMENTQRTLPAPAPVQNVDDWRLTENFRMENPIHTYMDGTRKFHLEFDMRQFKPEEIQVRTAGNTLTVTAKHDDKDQGKSVFREYNRSYVLPKDVQPERLTSKLSTGGVLTLEAPLPSLEGPREKLIPIKHN